MDIAILLLTFNRLDYLQSVFEKIREIKPKRLYISSDGPRECVEGEAQKVQEVRDYVLNHIDWECEVRTRFLDKNSGGCANGVSGAVTWFFENEQEGIILEDDCLPSTDFFSYCKILLERYRDNKKIYSICGYLPTDFANSKYSYEFASVSHCWGWASWADRWQKFSLDLENMQSKDISSLFINSNAKKYWKYILQKMKNKEIDSWYFPWNFCISANKGLTIFPNNNLISNIGNSGVHYDSCEDKRLNSKIFNMEINKFNDTFKTKKMDNILWKYFYDLQNPFKEKFIKKIFSIVNSDNHKVLTILGIKIKFKRKKKL